MLDCLTFLLIFLYSEHVYVTIPNISEAILHNYLSFM